MPVTENTPNRPAHVGRSQSLAEILAPKRPNIFGDDTGPGLPWEHRQRTIELYGREVIPRVRELLV